MSRQASKEEILEKAREIVKLDRRWKHEADLDARRTIFYLIATLASAVAKAYIEDNK